MLSVSNLSKSYGIKQVLKSVSFRVRKGERACLVGPNGSGKTTLCRILAGEEIQDSGSVSFNPGWLRRGYMPQGFIHTLEDTIGNFISSRRDSLAIVEHRLESIASELAVRPEDIVLQSDYEETLNQLMLLTQAEDQSAEILSQLNLDHIEPTTPVSFLSGGQKTRLSLAGILLSQPDFLLLDEPTNHLDIEMLEWLEKFLVRSTCTLFVISHDRAFLDHVSTLILELDAYSRAVTEYPGNYTSYLETKQAERNKRWQEFTDQQEEISRLLNSVSHIRGIARFRKGGKADTGDKFAKGFFANRGMETIRRAKSIEKRIDQLTNEDRIEKPRQTWEMKIEFDAIANSSRDVCVLESLAIGYDGRSLAADINITLKFHQRVALIGPNGAGKTTLLKTIAGILPPITGLVRLGQGVRLGYMAQEQEYIDPTATPLSEISSVLPSSETEARSFLSKYLFKGDDVFTPVPNMSYGERSRLSLAKLVAEGCNFLLLDEPINHLDIVSRVRFEESLKIFTGTILAVVHDRYFIHNFATTIWEVKNGSMQIIA